MGSRLCGPIAHCLLPNAPHTGPSDPPTRLDRQRSKIKVRSLGIAQPIQAMMPPHTESNHTNTADGPRTHAVGGATRIRAQSRLLGLAIVVGGMVAITLIAEPRTAPASSQAIGAIEEPTSSEPLGSGPILVELVGRDHRVAIHAGDPEPTCSVRTLEGEPIARGLTMAEVAARWPEFPLDRLQASVTEPGVTGGALMLGPETEVIPGLDD